MMENVAYFDGVENAHGIAYSRNAFHQMSRLTKHHRWQLKHALMSMRSDDSNDELLTGSRRTRRLDDGLRFVFERHGSALTVLAITNAGLPSHAKDTHS